MASEVKIEEGATAGVVDHQGERIGLSVRAADCGRTSGEQAAIEEAERREAKGHYASAAEWRDLAKKAREEDLRR